MSNVIVEQQAKLLAAEARQSNLNISKIFWFPNENEVRLIEVTESIQSTVGNKVKPFYFRPSPQYNLPMWSVIAMIRSSEVQKLKLPKGWGKWSDSIEL